MHVCPRACMVETLIMRVVPIQVYFDAYSHSLALISSVMSEQTDHSETDEGSRQSRQDRLARTFMKFPRRAISGARNPGRAAQIYLPNED